MVAMQVRDVPDEVRDDLAEEAKRRGLSLQTYLREVLTREARIAANRRLLDELSKREPVERLPGAPTASELIRRYRDHGY